MPPKKTPSYGGKVKPAGKVQEAGVSNIPGTIARAAISVAKSAKAAKAAKAVKAAKSAKATKAVKKIAEPKSHVKITKKPTTKTVQSKLKTEADKAWNNPNEWAINKYKYRNPN